MTSSFVLAPAALSELGTRPFGVYVHVPFCATRCGYCDFNTYTAGELGTAASPASWFDGLRRELDLAVTTLGALQAGDAVNIETDLLAKYVQRQLAFTATST